MQTPENSFNLEIAYADIEADDLRMPQDWQRVYNCLRHGYLLAKQAHEANRESLREWDILEAATLALTVFRDHYRHIQADSIVEQINK